ncbi:MAG: NAD-dependent epimerase/dehydratase family protein [Acidiferrobacterales bacterium]|nr:NAD-dependent epimerase/dehydratase family protein [Acidiferrobacterales bacterium]
MNLNGTKQVVIGGAGLIGSHVIDELIKTDVKEIVVFDNLTRGSLENLEIAMQDPRVRMFEIGGDITQPDILNAALENADGVYHLAALWLLHCWDYPESAFEVNFRGVFNVVQACIANKVKRLVYSSSASVYGDAVTEPMEEDHPYNNTNFYGASKIAGEHICRSLFHRHKGTENEFDYVGLRYMNVYGKRQDYHGAYIAVIMKMLDNLDKGNAPVVYGDGSQAYDFVNVVDCGIANVRAMQADTTDSFYNVGTGIKTTIKELAELVLDITGSDLEIQYEPAGMTFVKNRIGSPTKATEEIGFTGDIRLREGLVELIEWRNSHKAEVEKRRKAAGIPS